MNGSIQTIFIILVAILSLASFVVLFEFIHWRQKSIYLLFEYILVILAVKTLPVEGIDTSNNLCESMESYININKPTWQSSSRFPNLCRFLSSPESALIILT
jgi:hypothetical protein